MGSVSRRCNTYKAVTKKGGKTTLTAHIVVAADGKTRITTQTGKDGQGQTVNNKIFYEKQRRMSINSSWHPINVPRRGRVETGHGFGRTDSGHGVADLSGH
jgi:hypothetical protein